MGAFNNKIKSSRLRRNVIFLFIWFGLFSSSFVFFSVLFLWLFRPATNIYWGKRRKPTKSQKEHNQCHLSSSTPWLPMTNCCCCCCGINQQFTTSLVLYHILIFSSSSSSVSLPFRSFLHSYTKCSSVLYRYFQQYLAQSEREEKKTPRFFGPSACVVDGWFHSHKSVSKWFFIGKVLL